jgi:tRNA threonylcarbamoyladenosine biosynthesis protein TsaB
VMNEADIPFAMIDRIAVTTGPGSFTGLRVGISAARGIALASGKPAVGLSTLVAYAAPCIAEGNTFPVVAAIDARHGHVYLQVFGAGGRTLVGPCIVSVSEAARAGGEQPHVVGSAANLVAAAWPQGEKPPSAIDPRPAPDIHWVALLGAAAEPGNAPPKPFYLRAPDAQPQDAARLPRR